MVGTFSVDDFKCTQGEGKIVQYSVRNNYNMGARDGMYGIYCTEAQGRKVALGLSAIDAMHAECKCYTVNVEILAIPLIWRFGDRARNCQIKNRQHLFCAHIGYDILNYVVAFKLDATRTSSWTWQAI